MENDFNDKVLNGFQVARIMMLCGALNDIAEKSKEKHTGEQVKKVQIELEKIITADQNAEHGTE